MTATTGLIGDTIFLDRDGDDAFDPGEGLGGCQGGAAQTAPASWSADRHRTRTASTSSAAWRPGPTRSRGHDDPARQRRRADQHGRPRHRRHARQQPVDGDDRRRGGSTCAGLRLPAHGAAGQLDRSGTLWEDTNADGTLPGGEAVRFQVSRSRSTSTPTATACWMATTPRVGTTNTDSNGNYSFNNLPNGTYFVDVTDEQRPERLLEVQRHRRRAATTTASSTRTRSP